MATHQTILLVEDNAANRTLLRDILTYHGYKVLEAKNGVEGLAMTRAARPDLVLMDIQMPVMDGFTAGKLLKNDPDTKGIKVIALTSFAMRGDRERFLAAGFDDYLPKPIDTRELPRVIRGHLLAGRSEGPC